MKALELLREYQYADDCLNGLMGVALNEAITELEELQAPKTCEGCAYEGMTQEDTFPCELCTRATDRIDRYEPKENQ